MKRMWIFALIALAGCGSDPVQAGAPPSTQPPKTGPNPFTECVPNGFDRIIDYVPVKDPNASYPPSPPPAALAEHFAIDHIFAPMQAALEAAASDFDADLSANNGSGSAWVVATDSLGNRVVADPAKDGEVPTRYVLESSNGDDLMQFGLIELLPGIWAVEHVGNC